MTKKCSVLTPPPPFFLPSFYCFVLFALSWEHWWKLAAFGSPLRNSKTGQDLRLMQSGLKASPLGSSPSPVPALLQQGWPCTLTFSRPPATSHTLAKHTGSRPSTAHFITHTISFSLAVLPLSQSPHSLPRCTAGRNYIIFNNFYSGNSNLEIYDMVGNSPVCTNRDKKVKCWH